MSSRERDIQSLTGTWTKGHLEGKGRLVRLGSLTGICLLYGEVFGEWLGKKFIIRRMMSLGLSQFFKFFLISTEV